MDWQTFIDCAPVEILWYIWYLADERRPLTSRMLKRRDYCYMYLCMNSTDVTLLFMDAYMDGDQALIKYIIDSFINGNKWNLNVTTSLMYFSNEYSVYHNHNIYCVVMSCISLSVSDSIILNIIENYDRRYNLYLPGAPEECKRVNRRELCKKMIESCPSYFRVDIDIFLWVYPDMPVDIWQRFGRWGKIDTEGALKAWANSRDKN